MQDESSFGLIARAKAGDDGAIDRLILRYFPRLKRWARRGVPMWARDFNDTEDLVQETLVHAFRNLPRLQMQSRFSFRTYMRRAITNRINDELRRALRRPPVEELRPSMAVDATSPATRCIAKEDLWRCRAALARLRPSDRRVILARLAQENVTYRGIATSAGRPSEDAVRVALARALTRLAREMQRLENPPR